ncbi:Paired amphipathic helix protein Sin3b [Ceratobasidium sp. 428]|nr:Paired amphipathic helix protein Sin3b [Ceratobasidium sp. 428]
MTGTSGEARIPKNLNDAFAYVNLVKNTYSDQPEVYDEFLNIMKEFKTGLATTAEVADRVEELFNGHPELISQFDVFLPPGHHA